MKTIYIQANKIAGDTNYQLSASTNDVIEKAIFVKITENDLKDLIEMMEEEI